MNTPNTAQPQSQAQANPILRRFLTAAAIGFGLGAAATGFAMPPGGPSDGCGRYEAGDTPRAFAPMRELVRLHDELKLDAKQEELWQTAAQGMRDSMRESGTALREQQRKTLAALDVPGADLRAVFAQMDPVRDEVRGAADQRRVADRERWLAFYDSLNPTQKEQARVFVRHQIERAMRFGQHPARQG